jgi:hypothetical protein
MSSNTKSRKPATNKRPWNKIAQLPKTLRDKINHMLLDGFTYSRIRDQLAADVPTLNKMDLSRWKRGGHKTWLLEQQHISIVQSRFDHITDLLATTNPNKLPADLLALASIRLAEFLAQLDSAELLNGAQSDPKILARFLSILPRIARESLNQRKYNETGPPAQAQSLADEDDDQERIQRQNDLIVRRLDRALGIRGPIRFIEPLPKPTPSHAPDSVSGDDTQPPPDKSPTINQHPTASPSPGGEGRGEGEPAVPQGDIPHSELPTPHSTAPGESIPHFAL